MKVTLEFDSWDELTQWMQKNATVEVEFPDPELIGPAKKAPDPELIGLAKKAPEPEPVQEEPQAVEAPAPAGPVYTLDMIAGAMADLIDQGKDKMAQVSATIQKYGVPAINELDPANYAAFAEDLKALGGKFDE